MARPRQRKPSTAAATGYVRKPFTKHELFDELAQFLPRHLQPAPGTDAGSTFGSGVETDPLSPAAPELLAELRRLLVEEWPSVRDSMAINETKVFAQKLENLGQQWQCEPLTSYASLLIRDADDYAVVSLEKRLGDFSNLVEQLGPPVAA